MKLSTELAEAIIVLQDAEAEVVSITKSIKEIRAANATTIAGLEEMLEQAEADLEEAQEEAVKVAASFASQMTLVYTKRKRSS